jgi:integrase
MPLLRRNHRQILGARAIGGKQTRYRIEGVRGLWLYVSPTGKKTWYARYQMGSGKRRQERWFWIGDASSLGLAKATLKAQETRNRAQVEERDPHAERAVKRSDALTFSDLFHEWHERHALPKLARAPLDLSIYKFHLDDDFARRAFADIKRTDIGKLRDQIAKASGPIGSNNVIILINRVLNWAVDEGMIEFNPGARLRKAGQPKPRERVLSADEIRKLWRALAAMERMTGEHVARAEPGRMLTPATRSVLRLLLLTGQRRIEVSGAEKAELDMSKSEPVWTIPGSRTKNGLLHRVPLTPMAASEFERALSTSPRSSAYVFATPAVGASVPILASTVTRAMSRVTAELDIKGASPHDLRRTVGTELARLGIDVNVRKLVLNHAPRSRDVTETVYNRYAYDKEKRDALTSWEKRLLELIGQTKNRTAATKIDAG